MTDIFTFGSVCSGIEAASVAWHPLGWRAAWLAEIEPFPSAVLKHHYPEVPNLGDMTTLPDRIRSGEVEAPDLFCGGTPCQAFSVAGLRRSLDDARGNLSLTFCEIANAIDSVRRSAGKPASIIFWENVPGVLSTADNAFGCFLAGLAGEDDPLVPPGGKWTNAGCVLGPQRAVAWRVLDAQYFGVAQRRRRVFVVASARDGFDPAAVLFEWEGVRRDSAPSREAGQGTAHATAPCLTSSGRGVERTGDTRGQDPVVAVAVPSTGDISHCLNAGGMGRQDYETETLIAHSLRGEGFDASEDGTGRGTPLVPVAFADTAPTLSVGAHGAAGHPHRQHGNETAIIGMQPVAFTQNSRTDVCHAIGTGSGQGCATAAVGTDCFNGDITGDVAATMGTRGSSQNASGPTVMQSMQVRRLTPVECERLQGFPDGYTAIPWRKKPASECPDGPRYKALGNSWAVPVVRWIGRRIHHAVQGSNPY
jgi:DNA (cytosine-5)-methyltransferase 1